MGTRESASANPPAGGQNTNTSATNPPAGGLLNLTPANGAPVANQSANPPAGGQTETQAAPEDNSPVARDVYNERVRAEQALRKRVQELEDRVKREDDAKLTDDQRREKQLQEYAEREQIWAQEKRSILLRTAITERARERGLVDANAVSVLLQAEFGDAIDFDDNGVPMNAPYLVDRLVEKYDWLIQKSEQSPPPNAGRNVSPQRTPTGQFAQNRQETPIPPDQWARLGNFNWSKADEKRQQ